MTKFKFIFALFDDGGAESASAPASGLGEEARAFLRSIGESEEAISELTQREPIREDSPAESEAIEEQVGQAQEEPVSEETFADLIKKGGKYHDEYGQAVSQAIQQRFRNQADYKSTVEGYNEALSPLFERYGVQPGDIEGLSDAIAQDDVLYADEAEREGLTVEQYKRNLKLQREAERGRAIQEAYENEQRRNQLYAEWDAQADELRQSFPNFDLGMEIQNNETFANLIDNGVSVNDAFMATHIGDILNGISNESSAEAKRGVIENIKSRAARPPENGAKHNPAAVKKLDPSQFTDADIDKILADVQNGKPFSL